MSNEKSVMAVIRAARPSFRNNTDKVAFAVHAAFLSSGLVLTATGSDALDNNVFASTTTDEVGMENWNIFVDHYAFVYIDPEKGSKKVLVKYLVMNGKLLVDTLVDGSSQPLHLQIDIDNYVGENANGNYSAQYKNLEKLVKDLDKEVISKLYPSNPSRLATGERSRRGRSDAGVRIIESTGPHSHPSRVQVPPVYHSVGDDLLPGPGAGMYPTRGGFGGVGGGGAGGMLLGPSVPRWFGGEELGFHRAPHGNPPGARFDPYGPPGVPGFEPNRFIRNPPRRPGGGPHPDLEHFGDGSDFIYLVESERFRFLVLLLSFRFRSVFLFTSIC